MRSLEDSGRLPFGGGPPSARDRLGSHPLALGNIVIDVGSRVGDYEIIARLRSGGMATLFLARRKGAAGFARYVAIKLVHPHLAQDQHFVRMFVDEALLSARIQHPNVVHVEELGEAEGTHFLVMEYVHGCALSDLLRALARLERRLAPELSVWIAMEILAGLHAAHELRDETGKLLDVVHRDVSPQNVLLAQTGHIKVIDFGIAKASGRQQRTATGALKGKLRYMPPEQAFGKKLDRTADIYALGIVLWEMLTMRRLFSADNDLAMLDEVRNPKVVSPMTYADDVTPPLDAVVMRALEVDPARRPRTALELRRALAEACPKVAALDASHMAEVLSAVLGEELAARRKSLPESLTGMSLSKDVPMAHEPTRKAARPRFREEVMAELTHSAPGAKYVSDDAGDAFEGGSTPPPIVASALDSTHGAIPSKRNSQTPTPILPQEGGARGASAERKIAIAALALAVVAVAGAGAVVFSGLSGDDGPAPMDPAATSPLAPTDIAERPEEVVEPPSNPLLTIDAGVTAPSDVGTTVAAEELRDRRHHAGMRAHAESMTEPTMMDMSLSMDVPIFDDDDF